MTVKWNVNTEGLDALASVLKSTKPISAATGQFVASTASAAPVLTGQLRRSIRINSLTADKASYGPHTVYAKIQDTGGTITVKRKKVLANKRTGEFFGKVVHIPGWDYMHAGGERGVQPASDAVANVLKQAVGG